jgi:hypothetical protein
MRVVKNVFDKVPRRNNINELRPRDKSRGLNPTSSNGEFA